MRLTPLTFDDLGGWSADQVDGAWPAFLASCQAICDQTPELRRGAPASSALTATCAHALEVATAAGARLDFFRRAFRPFLVSPEANEFVSFVTGYYEPEIDGSLEQTAEFQAPVLARPPDLVDMRAAAPAGWDTALEGAQRQPDGSLRPYPDRAAIEAGVLGTSAPPVVWLQDHVEVFFAQVQGSARIRLPDGRTVRLVYDGRNGRPYSSIGKALIASGAIPEQEMTLALCKAWLRANGLEIGQAGRNILQSNRSYVFFRAEPETQAGLGPIGAQGLPLTPLRSMAVDRNVWPYGTPVWIEADLTAAGAPSFAKGRLMIAQDTGSAIVGPARGDLYIGSGAAAGDIAGNIRHPARFVVFLPAAAQ